MSENKRVTIIRDPKGNIIGQATNVALCADGFTAEDMSIGTLRRELEEEEKKAEREIARRTFKEDE